MPTLTFNRDSTNDIINSSPDNIADAIMAAQGKVANAYTAVSNKGGTLPQTQNLTNLATAISSIPSGGGSKEKTYGNYYILDDDTVMPFLIAHMRAGGNTRNGVIMTDGLHNYDNTAIQSSYLFVSISGDYSATSIAPSSIQDVYYDSFNGIGIKKFVLKSITGNFFCYNTGLFWAANNSLTALTLKSIDLSNATSVTLQSTFVGFSVLEEVLLTSAKNLTLGRRIASIGGAFKGTAVSSLSFPALTTSSSINLQYAMSDTGTDIVRTLHFPSNLESTISTLDGYPLFGGTSGYVVLAFDLPATS